MNDAAELEVINGIEEHIQTVATTINTIITELYDRILLHDRSKLGTEELPGFVEYTPKLKDSTYGSEEYKRFLVELKPTLEHHYANNNHHPEHFTNGIKDMDLVDIIEMFCDWYAATKRHADGDIRKSIEINQKRFNFSEELASIFKNTVELLEYGT